MSRRARERSGVRNVIHKIVELAVALNLDSWYYVIRNRVDCKISKAIIKPKAIVDNSISKVGDSKDISPRAKELGC